MWLTREHHCVRIIAKKALISETSREEFCLLDLVLARFLQSKYDDKTSLRFKVYTHSLTKNQTRNVAKLFTPRIS